MAFTLSLGGTFDTEPEPGALPFGSFVSTVPQYVAPHFAFPLVPDAAGRFAVVEQDEPEHVRQCMEVVLRTERGTFDHQPSFGRRDLVGQPLPLGDDVLDALSQFEPRRAALVSEDIADLERRVDRIRVEVAPEAE